MVFDVLEYCILLLGCCGCCIGEDGELVVVVGG